MRTSEHGRLFLGHFFVPTCPIPQLLVCRCGGAGPRSASVLGFENILPSRIAGWMAADGRGYGVGWVFTGWDVGSPAGGSRLRPFLDLGFRETRAPCAVGQMRPAAYSRPPAEQQPDCRALGSARGSTGRLMWRRWSSRRIEIARACRAQQGPLQIPTHPRERTRGKLVALVQKWRCAIAETGGGRGVRGWRRDWGLLLRLFRSWQYNIAFDLGPASWPGA